MRTSLLFIFFTVALSLSALAADDKKGFTSIEHLIQTGIVEAKLKGVGRFQEKSISITLQNKTGDSVKVWIEAGRRLISDNPIYQDIFIVKEQFILLMPLESRNDMIYGFCCQVNDHVPAKDSSFSIGSMAPISWIQLAEFIDQNSFPIQDIQHSIWSVSDNLPISIIGGSEPLKRKVAEIKGIPVPWYSLTFEKDTALLFSGKAESLSGEIGYYLKNNAMVTVNIRSSNGLIKTTLMSDKKQSPGSYTIPIELDVKGWPKGKYAVYVYFDGATLLSKTDFEL